MDDDVDVPNGPDRPFETPFADGGERTGDLLLHRSPNFTVRSCEEDAFLQGRDLEGDLRVGDFLGHPSAAAIDPGEHWCVIVGWGVIVYALRPPWIPYGSPRTMRQWWERGCGPEEPLRLEQVWHVAGEEFQARGADGLFDVMAAKRTITALLASKNNAEVQRARDSQPRYGGPGAAESSGARPGLD